MDQSSKTRKRKDTLGMGINDCPLWLVKKFTQDAEKRFNDVYWVKLHDLMMKAEAYERLIGEVPGMEQYEQDEDEEDDPAQPLTFGSARKKFEDGEKDE